MFGASDHVMRGHLSRSPFSSIGPHLCARTCRYSSGLRNLVGQLLKKDPHSRPSTGAVLRRGLIKDKIGRFLSEAQVWSSTWCSKRAGSRAKKERINTWLSCLLQLKFCFWWYVEIGMLCLLCPSHRIQLCYCTHVFCVLRLSLAGLF